MNPQTQRQPVPSSRGSFVKSHPLFVFLLAMVMSLIAAPFQQALAQTTHVLYDDTTQNNWFNNPISATVNLAHTTTVYNGSNSMSVATSANGAMQFNKQLGNVDTAPYNSLSFWIHGGTSGGQKLKVELIRESTAGPRIEIVPAPQANTWSKVSIALSDLGAASVTNLSTIRIWEQAGVASTYYLDDIILSDEVITPLAGFVYDDVVRGSWFNNPFNATVNLNNTSPVKNGAKSMAVTITGGGGCAQVNFTGGGFNTTPYESVSFWIHGGTAGGQKLQLSLSRNSVQGPTWTIPDLQANTWVKHTVPLSSLGAVSATDVTAIWFRDANIGAQPVLYLDDIKFEPPSSYTLTYNGNGSTGGSVPVDSSSPYTPGSTVTVLGNTGSLVKSGSYDFAGWNTAANGSGTSYAVGATFSISGHTTLYAQWTYTGTTVAVTYDGNGNTSGTAPTDANGYAPGGTVTIAGNTGSLAKVGHVFAGWNTAANGSGTNYAAASTFAITANTTLYAKWTASPLIYTITYNGNGNTAGTVPVDTASPYSISTNVTVYGGGALAKSSLFFLNWNTAADGSGTSYWPGNTFIIGTNTTLYAQYGPFIYPYANYNLGLLDPQLTGWPLTTAEDTFVKIAEASRRPGSEVSQYRPTFWPITPSAGHFGGDGTGWLNIQTGLVSDVEANPGPLDILLVGDSITQQWQGQGGNPFNSSWQSYFGSKDTINLGIGGDKTQNVLWRLDHGKMDTIQPKVCVLQIGNNDMYFVPETGVNAARDGIVWCVRNLRHKFPNTPIILVNVFPIVTTPGNTFFNNLKATHDALNALNLPGTDPMVHMLDLWDNMIQADGTGDPQWFYDGTHPNTDGYDLWASSMEPLMTSLLEPALTYNGNGSTGGSVPTDANSPYQSGATVTVLGNTGSLVRANHVFAGWNTAANGAGVSYSAGNTFTITAPTTLYAQWTFTGPYTVTYDGNGNTGGNAPTDPSSPYTSGSTVTVLGNTGSLVKTASIFAGWNTAANGSGTNYAAGGAFAITANTTLYAKWAAAAATAWDGGGSTDTLWTNAANWNTMADGSGGNPAASPATGETATFNITTLNGTVTTTLAASITLGGIVVNNTGTTNVYTDGGTGSRIINLGAGGITINAGAGSVRFAETNAANKKVQFVLTANQSWINNGSGTLTLASDSAPNINVQTFRLTFGGSGNISTMGRFGGAGGFTKTGAGTLTSTGGSSYFTGSLILEGGIWDAQTFANINTVSDIGKGSVSGSAADLVFGGGTLRHSAANVAGTDRLFTIGNSNGLTATIDSSAVSATNTMSFTGTGALAYGGSGARTLTLKGSNTGTNSFAPVIGDGTGGATSLVKDGTGAWTVSGANNYTGATTILDGTLSVTAPNFADTSTVTIGTSAGSPAVLNLPNAGTDNVAVLIIDGVTKAAGLYDKDNSGGAITGNGKINVGAVSDYDTWKTANSVTGGPTADDDGDGVKNFDEYAFGLNPKSGASASPISSPLNKATGLFKYTRRKQSLTALTYTYESSTTLAGAWPTFTPDSATSNNGDPVEEITVDVPNTLLANPALFIRVKAVQP